MKIVRKAKVVEQKFKNYSAIYLKFSVYKRNYEKKRQQMKIRDHHNVRKNWIRF